MTILGIETSCDETAAAVVKNGSEILSNVIASSVEMHIKTGGIIPEAAAREQVKAIIPVVEQALLEATKEQKNRRTKEQKSGPSVPPFLGSSVASVDAIAVTVGPGLIGSLLVGVETARTLAWVWKKPLVPVNHLVGHIYANWLAGERVKACLLASIRRSGPARQGKRERVYGPKLPAIALVVSGGHTDLVLMKDHGQIEWVGGTRDDAAGECFDKTARLLGLGYPGGPAIAAEAEKWKMANEKWKITLPRPLINEKTFDFSFSGLKTAVLREVEKLKNPTSALAYEIQEAITDVLVDKTLKAVQKYSVNTLLVAGGVAANQRLKEKFQWKMANEKWKIALYVPPSHLCTDNAAMIAAAAFHNYKPVPWKEVQALPSLHF